jgi:hypothetical protein
VQRNSSNSQRATCHLADLQKRAKQKRTLVLTPAYNNHLGV